MVNFSRNAKRNGSVPFSVPFFMKINCWTCFSFQFYIFFAKRSYFAYYSKPQKRFLHKNVKFTFHLIFFINLLSFFPCIEFSKGTEEERKKERPFLVLKKERGRNGYLKFQKERGRNGFLKK